MMMGISMAVAFDTAITWARWYKWLHPIATLRARLRERPARTGGGGRRVPA